MWLSDTSVKRPVLAGVVNLLIILFGFVAFLKLPLREYPDVDEPIISIETLYTGASASVVESRVTKIIEDRMAGLEGVRSIESRSADGKSDISIQFHMNRNIDDAAADVRDKVSSVLATLPIGIDPPEISKASVDDDVIMWLHLVGDGMPIMDITEYAVNHIVDNFSSIEGVARVRIGGALYKSMRIWLKPNELAARGLTQQDVEDALKRENVELPAGEIESENTYLTVRVARKYLTPEAFAGLGVSKGESGYVIKLGEVADIEVGPDEARASMRGNGSPMVSIGIIKQSRSNTLEVVSGVKAKMEHLNATLPRGMYMSVAYDSSVFVSAAINEVYHALIISIVLVGIVIFLFLGDVRAMLIPMLMVPVSLIGAFIVLWVMDYSINLLTLLALVLAIGLVVDDAIVVLENIHRRFESGESAVNAAYFGTRQVAFAVIATTLVLVAVFIPLLFLEGEAGRLFAEFAVVMVASILLSGFAALTACPMLASKMMGAKTAGSGIVDRRFEALRVVYGAVLTKIVTGRKALVLSIFVVMIVSSTVLLRVIPSEFVPQEDRGIMTLSLKGPEGASYSYMMEYVVALEQKLMPFIKSGEFKRVLIKVPGSFSSTSAYNTARGSIVLSDWGSGRKPIWYYARKIRSFTYDLGGVKVSAVPRQALGYDSDKPVQFVVGGPTYEEAASWADMLIREASKNPGLNSFDTDYSPTKPQLQVSVDEQAAANVDVSLSDINNALGTLLGGKKVTTYEDKGREYDVILEADKSLKRSPADLASIYVRSKAGDMVPLLDLVRLKEFADAAVLNRYNRARSVTIEADLASDYSLGQALSYLDGLAYSVLPAGSSVAYKGESLRYIESTSEIYFVFMLAILVVFLVLAAQFESLVHPLVIMCTVPLAVFGALCALWVWGHTLNIYSQIGLIILIGIATKNGILIVEFANQLRAGGVEADKALLQAASLRFRPIVMTTLTTVIGAVPLVLASGAGSESRSAIGIVIVAGLLVAAAFTVFVIPVAYKLIARNVRVPVEITERQQEGQAD